MSAAAKLVPTAPKLSRDAAIIFLNMNNSLREGKNSRGREALWFNQLIGN
jgi:hypothetical protein